MKPTVIEGYKGMKDGDGLLMFNFRADRARQILTALLDPRFDGFNRSRVVKFAMAVGMVEYSAALNPFLKTLYPPEVIKMGLGETVSKAGLHALMAEAADSGDFDLPRREGSDHVTPIDGVTATVMTRLPSVGLDAAGRPVNATDPWFLTEAEIAGRRQALEYARFLVDRVPGYEHASLVALGTQVGVRETRRVHGDARLTGEDVLAARQTDDQIGLCGAPIEDHHPGADTRWRYLPDGAAVGIPYRTLVVRDAANVLVAGRCFSATHDAHASVRSMAQCMAMGQAAGTAAAMAVATGHDPRDLDTGILRDRLRAAGAIVDLEAAVDAPSLAVPA